MGFTFFLMLLDFIYMGSTFFFPVSFDVVGSTFFVFFFYYWLVFNLESTFFFPVNLDMVGSTFFSSLFFITAWCLMWAHIFF